MLLYAVHLGQGSKNPKLRLAPRAFAGCQKSAARCPISCTGQFRAAFVLHRLVVGSPRVTAGVVDYCSAWESE